MRVKTLLWAASALLANSAPTQNIVRDQIPAGHIWQLRQQANISLPSYRRVLPSLAGVYVRGEKLGTAVLIDTSGFYLSTKIIGLTGEVELHFHNNHVGHATVVSQDGCTQMVLLRSDYVPMGSEAVTAVNETPPNSSVLVIVEKGAVSARVVSNSRLGMMKPSNRVVPFSEIRLELPETSLGGAPVFTSEGEFVGLLSGALIPNSPSPQMTGGLALKDFNSNKFFTHQKGFGPADLSIVYLPSPDVLHLVLEGFQSRSHVVDHPSLGVFCRDGADGALVEEVVNDSAASRIGMREGDLIKQIGDFLIQNKSDFAKVLFKIRAGQRLPVRFDRDGRTIVKDATLGSSPD